MIPPARTARSGASESLVTSPAHTRSHSALEHLWLAGARVGTPHLTPEARPVLGQRGADRLVQMAVSAIGLLPAGCQQRDLVGEAQAHPPITLADRSGTEPDHLAARAQLVERRRPESVDAGRKQIALDRRRHQRSARQHPDGVDQCFGTAARGGDAVPGRQEPRQRLGFDRLDLAAQRGQRAPSQLAQHVGVAPLALHTVGAELAPHQALVVGQRLDRTLDAFERGTEPTRHVVGEERPVRASEAGDELFERAWHRIGEGRRETDRQRAAERVAVAGGVVGGGVAQLAGDDELDRPALGDELGDHGRAVAFTAQIDLGRRQLADPPQHVVQLVGRTRPATVGEALQLELDIGEHTRVEQLAQLFGAEQFAQQVAVERERCCPAFGERGVAFVHVCGDPVEQQARRHRARRGRVDVHETDLAAVDEGQHLAQSRHVEHVLQALARRFEQDRERRVLGGHRQQVGRPLALLPQRRAPIGSPPRQQQRPPGTLAEPGREQRRLGQARHDQLVDLVGGDDERLDVELVGRFGQADHDPVVAPHRLDRQIETIHEAALDGHRPRRVDRSAERAQQAHPPVADLVAEALDHDRACRRERPPSTPPARRGIGRRSRQRADRGRNARRAVATPAHAAAT